MKRKENHHSIQYSPLLTTLLISTLFIPCTKAQNSWNPKKEWKSTHPHLVLKDQKATAYPDSTDAGVLINNRIPGRSSNYIQIEFKPSTYERVHKEQFHHETKLAQSVFIATTGTGTAQGTAFLVGKDLVLTNKHVLASDKDCRKFAISLNHKKETVSCKKVEYCDKTEDFCLIRMNSMENKATIGSEVSPLKLQPNPRSKNKNEMMIAIGNSYAVGVQSASFPGMRIVKNTLFHCIRVFSGNSGSPILDTNFDVLGIHYGRAGAGPIQCPEDRLPGVAVTSKYILDQIKKHRPEVYSEITPLDSKRSLNATSSDSRQNNSPLFNLKKKDRSKDDNQSKQTNSAESNIAK